ncbi:MAG: glutamate formimidoyltransferase [Acidaminococcus sp.]|jgi:glutamate formiminotransferase|nr:glutamate formimidoyltransferase [Acidaminococcus sp.]MCI2099652.1 glutamate formimidoyltransferase [Acidaminococcus sp.]MCI2113943.1 glutamate formimidoyltransferase [Acidaminococcus sp.]MCI2115820.1 glutamate formimidoyltransferase [Acidaminococcus sp.]
MEKTLMAEVNFSEGRNEAVINKIKDAMLDGNPIDVMEISSDPNHNRTVFTFKGNPTDVLEATKRLSAKAIELIDMRHHSGAHPRIGAVDVVPFIPVRNVETEEALKICREYGKFMGNLGVPVYYYEDAATREERKSLPKIRKGQYEGLEEKMKDPQWYPDEGPNVFNAKSGATVTGVRFPLVAFNVNLQTKDIEIGKKIVKAVRAATGGYQNVRAIALALEDRGGIVQVSMNLTNYEKTPIHRVFETIKSEASQYGVGVVDCDLVGPVPIYALEDVLKFYLRVHRFSMEQLYK